MALEFRLRDFFHPVAMTRHWLGFRRSQWLPEAELLELQSERLRAVVMQAARKVPYYGRLFADHGIRPEAIRTPADLARVPSLSKATLRAEGERLHADDHARYGSHPVTTSGTSGMKLTLLMDKGADVLEFNYYRRFWGWAGYHIGMPFAEFSTVFFQKKPERRERVSHWSAHTRRLLLNSVELSLDRVRAQVEEMRRRRTVFAKGLPSVLFHFADYVRKAGVQPPRMRALFSQGELLTPATRRFLTETFGCPVLDSYGQMERAVALSECEHGKLHAVSDYGILETTPVEGGGDPRLVRFVGTGLYNMAMPLLRYEIGDVARLPADPAPCPCGRSFPVIEALMGREAAAIKTPDGRVITAAFLVFEEFDSISSGSLRQDSDASVVARVVRTDTFTAAEEAALAARVQALVGRGMRVSVEVLDHIDSLRGSSGKISA